MTIRLQNRCRINKFVLIIHFVMQMIASAGTCRSYIPYEIPFLYGLSFTDRDFVHMGVSRFPDFVSQKMKIL